MNARDAGNTSRRYREKIKIPYRIEDAMAVLHINDAKNAYQSGTIFAVFAGFPYPSINLLINNEK